MKPKEGNPYRDKLYPTPSFATMEKQKLNKQFSKFFDIFKKLYVNILFMDDLEQILSYV